MRIPLFLLLPITANLVGSNQSVQEIKFPAIILEPDLKAISQYFQNVDNTVTAYVHWPSSTTFSIRMNEDYLEIVGDFNADKTFDPSTTYNGLYYKQDKFYIKEKPSYIPKEIHSATSFYYRQAPSTPKTTPYVQIRYAGLNELRPEIEAFYDSHKSYFDKVLPTHPATFLATLPKFKNHFLEYTFWGESAVAMNWEDRLRILITDDTRSKVMHNTYAHRLVFDQRNRDLIVPTTSDVEDSQPFKNILGVRMESVGFLARVTDTEVTMLGDEELLRGGIDAKKEVSLYDVRKKMLTVEPRLLNARVNDVVEDYVPRSGKFQVHGQIFVKKFHLVGDGMLNRDCPMLIEKENNEPIATLGDRALKTICANDDNVWYSNKSI